MASDLKLVQMRQMAFGADMGEEMRGVAEDGQFWTDCTIEQLRSHCSKREQDQNERQGQRVPIKKNNGRRTEGKARKEGEEWNSFLLNSISKVRRREGEQDQPERQEKQLLRQREELRSSQLERIAGE